jgi:lipopolysaccharide/colanic/teichoic acid biosynthesis glycosyltransferase
MYVYLKHALDKVAAVVLIAVLLPVYAAAAAAVLLAMGRPVLFLQRRPGLGQVPFSIYKFRTMTDGRGPDGEPLPDTQRLTRLGRLLRSTSVDELPELFNVLKGEMSLVGPRPLLMAYGPYYTEEERLRFTVRPGITGLAQVSGRNYLGWEERLGKDVEYVRNMSLGLDLRILLRTVKVMLRTENVAVDTSLVEERLDWARERARREAAL